MMNWIFGVHSLWWDTLLREGVGGVAWSCLKFGMPDLVVLYTVRSGWEMGKGGNGGVRDGGGTGVGM